MTKCLQYISTYLFWLGGPQTVDCVSPTTPIFIASSSSLSAMTLKAPLVAIAIACGLIVRGAASNYSALPDFGVASTFACLAGTFVTATGGPSIIVGDVGSSPGVMPPDQPASATIIGTNYGTNNITAAAQTASLAVHDQLDALLATPAPAALAGVTLIPGVYSSATFTLASGTLVFDAINDSSATFVLVSPGYLLVSAPFKMLLVNGALASHIVWAIRDYASLAA